MSTTARKIGLRTTASRIMMLFALFVTTSCSTTPSSISDDLDPLTAITITTVDTPLVFYRDTPAQGVHARNFVNLGPVKTNQVGQYRYFLWLGIWSTAHKTNLTVYQGDFESVVLFVDGEPLLLDLAGWTPESVGLSQPPYLKPVASTADAYYRVTADQIRLMANATDIRLRSAGANEHEYVEWDNQKAAHASLAAFVDYDGY